MLGEIFYWLFNMSIIASVSGLIVLLIRKLKIIPYRVSLFLWLIPFIRMCIPFGMNSSYSLLSLVSSITKNVVVFQPIDEITFSETNVLMAANSYSPFTYKTAYLKKLFEISAIIWLVGLIVIVLTLLVIYISTIHEMQLAQHFNNNVFFSNNVRCPAVYGIIKPRIVLPNSLTGQDTSYIIQHERTHIRHHDNLWRIMFILATAIHWYNPLCWCFLKSFLEDIEFSCDESIVANLSDKERKEYSCMLLQFTQDNSFFLSAFGGSKIHARIENILSYKKLTVFSFTCFSVLVSTISFVLMTNVG